MTPINNNIAYQRTSDEGRRFLPLSMKRGLDAVPLQPR